jgi:hypothetical protein
MSLSVYLNTRDSLTPNSSDEFEFHIPSLPLSNVSQYDVLVRSVQFDVVNYAINAYANTIKWEETDSATTDTYTATLTSQSYTGATLATAIALAMTTASAANFAFTYTGTYNSNTRFITITLSTGIPNVFRFIDVANDAYRVMGFNFVDSPQVFIVYQTSDNAVSLAGTSYVDLLSRTLQISSVSSTTTASVLARIPITAAQGSVQTWQSQSDKTFKMGNDTLEKMDFYLRDDLGNAYPLSRLHPLSIHLEFHLGNL